MRHTSPNRIKGFTIVEVLFVALTLGIIMTGLFYALIAGESSWSFSTAKIEVRSEVGRAVDWIAKDVRQTVRWDIGSSDNNPLSTHIKFRKVIGYNTAGAGSALLSSNFIEYTYDPDLKIITRTDSSTDQTWIFRYITQAPFYTNSNGSIRVIDPLSPGQDSPVFQTGNLVIILAGQKQVKSGLNATYALTEEVRIRN